MWPKFGDAARKLRRRYCDRGRAKGGRGKPRSSLCQRRLLEMLVACWTIFTIQFSAIPVGAERALNRDILGLYNGKEEGSADASRLHRLLEMPLNHLGYRLKLHDVSRSLPDLEEAKRFYAVATWFSGGLEAPEAYLDWAANLARAGVRFVVLDSVGALGAQEELPAINAFLAEMGLRYAPYYVGDAAQTKIEKLKPSMVSFEHKLDARRLPGHQVIVPASDAVETHLSVTDPAHQWVDAKEAVLVSTSSKGGLVASGFSIHYDAAANRVQWIVNPFEFLEAALGRRTWPIPDTTTMSGRRLYFSHIDGDGWTDPTTVQPYADRRAIAAQVVLEKLIEPYPDLPVTVGLIGGDVSTKHGGNVDGGLVALRMFALPQVEVASHTLTHPYQWSFFATYDRDKELTHLARQLLSSTPSEGRLVELIEKATGRSLRAVAAAAPESPANDIYGKLPMRARPFVPFDLEQEVGEALRLTARLAPQGKEPRVYLWSGDTRPFEAALREVRKNDVRNMNGGDSRFDSVFPSVAYVAPISRAVGAERQIYAVNSNENTYTNGWQGPFDAFSTLTETLENTERPRRLKGINLYYHIYSATRPDALQAVIGHLERARSDRVAPITASHYAGIAEGFFTAQIEDVAPLRWVVRERGDLDTLRFDGANEFEVDYASSSGVIGHNRAGEALYVTLDPAEPTVVVALVPLVGRAAANRTRQLRLVDSRWRVSGVSPTSCDLRARVQGFGPGDMVWQGVPGVYEVALKRNAAVLQSQRVRVGADGNLMFRLTANAIEPLDLRIVCIGSVSAVAKPEQVKRKAVPKRNAAARLQGTSVSCSGPAGSAKGRRVAGGTTTCSEATPPTRP